MRDVLQESVETIRKSASAPEAIFISHQRSNAKLAEQTWKYLEAYGYEPWLALLDSDVQAAHDAGDHAELTRRIVAAIRTCPRMIALISEAGLASQWVPFEVGAATALEKDLALMLMPDVDLSEVPIYFAPCQKIVSEAQLTSWLSGHTVMRKSGSMQLTEAMAAVERAALRPQIRAALNRDPRLYVGRRR